jgi:hypothetical protein
MQLIRKTDDPRLPMLRRFAKTMGIDVADLLNGPKKRVKP